MKKPEPLDLDAIERNSYVPTTRETLMLIAEVRRLRSALAELIDALDSRSPFGSGAGAEESWERIDAAIARARELLGCGS